MDLKGFLLLLLIVIVCICTSALITVGIVKLICWCFGLAFSWKIAIGVWLIMCLVTSVFSNTAG